MVLIMENNNKIIIIITLIIIIVTLKINVWYLWTYGLYVGNLLLPVNYFFFR